MPGRATIVARTRRGGCDHGHEFARWSRAFACQEPPTWERFESAVVGFAVEFPKKPTVKTEQQLTGLTMTEVEIVGVDRGPRGQLQVSSYLLAIGAAELPVESMLQLDCMAAYQDSKFIPGSPRKVMLAGQEGVAVTGIAPRSPSLPNGGWSEDRCAILGDRMVHLIAIGPDDAETRSDGARFLDSLGGRSPARP